jgi:nicotinamide riboside kinase
MPLKKIVVIGPESTGKSTLSEGLAAHFHTEWVREYAREYLEQHGMGYSYETLSAIAKGQLVSEDRAVERLRDEAGPAWRVDGLLFPDGSICNQSLE